MGEAEQGGMGGGERGRERVVQGHRTVSMSHSFIKNISYYQYFNVTQPCHMGYVKFAKMFGNYV